jgi:hypothetical protein
MANVFEKTMQCHKRLTDLAAYIYFMIAFAAPHFALPPKWAKTGYLVVPQKVKFLFWA